MTRYGGGIYKHKLQIQGGGDGVVATVEEDTRLWTACAKGTSALLLWLEIDSALNRFEGGGCFSVVASHGDIAEEARGGGGGRVGVIDISLLVDVLHEAEANDTL
uniref:Uncharacterized protein n=1 Tax=Glossina palpalis gambiensis TaxID=67801 RepID=A0A1B0ATP1_9MUSC